MKTDQKQMKNTKSWRSDESNLRPEDNRQNVAFYKKGKERQQQQQQQPQGQQQHKKYLQHLQGQQQQQQQQQHQHGERQEHQEIAQNVERKWSEVASSAMKMPPQSSNMKRVVRIAPLFQGGFSGEEVYDRIVVRLDHFNNRKFSGYITVDEAEIVRKAVGIKYSSLHGITFDRSSKGELSITFRLKHSVREEEIKKELNSHFWFDKKSKNGNLDRVRGHVVFPSLPDNSENQKTTMKEIRLEGCNYEVDEKEILGWIQMYGVIQGDVEEEAIILNEGSDEEVTMGTGVYLVQARLDRLIPNVLPIQQKKVKVWYQGVKRQCNCCYGYHKKETVCLEKSFDEYTREFNENNANILAKMFESKSFESYTKEFKANNLTLPDHMFKHGDKEDEEDDSTENTKNTDNNNNDQGNYNNKLKLDHHDNEDEDKYAFLDISQGEKTKSKIETDTDIQCKQTLTEAEIECYETLTEDQVEEWTLQELEVYLLTFTPTEEETSWLNKATKDIHCDTETEAMPFFKEIIKKRLF